MTSLTPTTSDDYWEYANLLLRQHALLASRREEAPELEVVEGQLADLWNQLDPGQQRSLAGLRSDLNWVRRGFRPARRSSHADLTIPRELGASDRAAGS